MTYGGWFASTGIGGYQRFASHAVNATFDQPVSGIFECALTAVSGTDVETYLNDPNPQLSGFPIPTFPGRHQLGMWDNVRHVRMVVIVTSHRNRDDYGRCVARLMYYEKTPTALTAASTMSGAAPSFTSYGYDKATGAILHAETYYGRQPELLKELRKGRASEAVEAHLKGRIGSKLKYAIVDTEDDFRDKGDRVPFFDLKKKSLVTVAPADLFKKRRAAPKRKPPTT